MICILITVPLDGYARQRPVTLRYRVHSPRFLRIDPNQSADRIAVRSHSHTPDTRLFVPTVKHDRPIDSVA